MLSTRVIEPDGLPEMLEEVLDATIALQHADFGTIQLYDPTNGVLRLATQRGLSPTLFQKGATVDVDGVTPCARAIRQGNRVIIKDVEKDRTFSPCRPLALQAGFRAVQSTPIRGHGGALKGVISTYFRQPHRPSNKQLQVTDIYMRLVAELIARFQNEEVLLARSASEVKSRFLANASHDLRQSLQAAVLYLSELGEKIEGPEQSELVSLIQGPLDDLAEILNALLDVSRLERGAVTTEIRDFDLSEMLRELISNNLPQAQQKGLRLSTEGYQGCARSDRALLKRLVGNFISNAIRYTDAGDVTVRCERVGGDLRISVADSGKGIPVDKCETIFDEYVQLDNPSRDPTKGLGLGLSVVKYIARILGHRIRVTSTLGQGSTFSVELPASLSMSDFLTRR